MNCIQQNYVRRHWLTGEREYELIASTLTGKMRYKVLATHKETFITVLTFRGIELTPFYERLLALHGVHSLTWQEDAIFRACAVTGKFALLPREMTGGALVLHDKAVYEALMGEEAPRLRAVAA